MALTSVGAIYATNSKLLQRVYIPHADDSEIYQQYVGPGESLTLVPIKEYRVGGADAVQVYIGAPAHEGICKVIHKETGMVLDRIVADPEIYKHPDGHHVILER